ncbi:MAG: hypothetical protein AAGJ87_16535, partial [Pseudomonadota bacterium]
VRRVRAGASTRFGPGWAGVVAKGASRIESEKSAPAASPWAWLFAVAAGLIAAWRLEGARGPRR